MASEHNKAILVLLAAPHLVFGSCAALLIRSRLWRAARRRSLPRPPPLTRPVVTVRDLPALNAVLNATSALLLLLGFLAIRRGAKDVHRRFMLGALVTSSLFLTSYLVYHFQVGSVRFTGQGWIRTAYLTILLTHTVLAGVIVPLILVTISRALRGRFVQHRRIARLTLPLWAYVSVTGVVIYWRTSSRCRRRSPVPSWTHSRAGWPRMAMFLPWRSGAGISRPTASISKDGITGTSEPKTS